MQVITTQTTVYSFEELSDQAKEMARQKWAEDLDNSWSETVIEDATTIGALMGWTLDEVYYSGFWSQGDGACFVGKMRYAKGAVKAVKSHAGVDEELHRIAKAWQDLQSKHFRSLIATVTKSHHRYSHENTVRFDVEDDRNRGRDMSDVEDEVEEIGKDFMRWIYKQLEKAYDYEVSLENVAEASKSNGYSYRENGSLY